MGGWGASRQRPAPAAPMTQGKTNDFRLMFASTCLFININQSVPEQFAHDLCPIFRVNVLNILRPVWLLTLSTAGHRDLAFAKSVSDTFTTYLPILDQWLSQDAMKKTKKAAPETPFSPLSARRSCCSFCWHSASAKGRSMTRKHFRTRDSKLIRTKRGCLRVNI